MDDRELIEEQIEYYRRRAPEYDETATPPGDPLAPYGRELEEALDRFAPTGDVLEIACGTGSWTRHLLRHATRITAIDASPEMIDLARERIGGDPRVEFVEADVFDWTPDRRYRVVFFANWLSHVPPTRFEEFWEIVRGALAPSGRAFLVDEAEDAWRHEDHEGEEFVEGPSVPLVRRTLRDGTVFRVVKVFWNPDEIVELLRDLGWEASIHRAGPFFAAEVIHTADNSILTD